MKNIDDFIQTLLENEPKKTIVLKPNKIPKGKGQSINSDIIKMRARMKGAGMPPSEIKHNLDKYHNWK